MTLTDDMYPAGVGRPDGQTTGSGYHGNPSPDLPETGDTSQYWLRVWTIVICLILLRIALQGGRNGKKRDGGRNDRDA